MGLQKRSGAGTADFSIMTGFPARAPFASAGDFLYGGASPAPPARARIRK
jgi:hypothetical protein